MKLNLLILFIVILHHDLIAQKSVSSFVYDFETSKTMPNWSGFGLEYEIGENPQIDGINQSILIGRIDKTNGKTWDWAAVVMDLPFYMDLSKNKVLSMKILAITRKSIVNFRLENSKNEFPSSEIMTAVTRLNEWEQMIFNFQDVNTAYQYDRLTIFIDYGNYESHVYYIDDIKLGP